MSKPSSPIDRCMEESKGIKVTVKAKGRSATFLNPDGSTIKKLDVGCWLASSTPIRADYIVSKPGIVDVIVELKGKDIEHGCEQILATHARWKSVPPFSPSIGGLIVFTRSPLSSADQSSKKALFLKKHHIWLEMGKSGLKDYSFDTFTGTRK